jgi:cytosine/adenosine deaminase-related metal-dependent hydrolase
MDDRRTIVQGRWVIEETPSGSRIRSNAAVVIEGSKIVDIVESGEAPSGRVLATEEGLVLPGFIDLHNHSLNGPLFRGLVEDRSRGNTEGSLVYSMAMPMGDLASKTLTDEEARAVYRLGMLEALKSGITCMLDMWRPEHLAFFDVARELGLRGYGAPYVLSQHVVGVDSQGSPVYASHDAGKDLERVAEIFATYDEGPTGRLRVVLGPHGTDTCSADTLRRVRRLASELGTLVTIHLAQSRAEATYAMRSYGKSPVEYLGEIGHLGPELIAAHCVFASDEDLALLRESGTSIASCPLTYARGGISAAFERFASAGIRTGIGTDAYCFDFIEELRAAGLVSKLARGGSHVGDAESVLRAGTVQGADSLHRSDLGRIARGAKADLVVVDLARVGLQPVANPIKNLIWNCNARDVCIVMIDGVLRVLDGEATGVDEARIVRAGSAAIERVWKVARGAGLMSGGAEPTSAFAS